MLDPRNLKQKMLILPDGKRVLLHGDDERPLLFPSLGAFSAHSCERWAAACYSYDYGVVNYLVLLSLRYH